MKKAKDFFASRVGIIVVGIIGVLGREKLAAG